MKRRILSIDFDYFINTDIKTRNEKFPDGADKIKDFLLSSFWELAYSKYPELRDIVVTEDFQKCCERLYALKFGKVLIADSHGDIEKLFPLIEPDYDLEVVHIDFHHDNYISGGNKVDCANWVRHLMQRRPNTRIEWVRREDSEMISLEGEFPYEHTADLNIKGEFDYIFLCFSPEWTPPHLEKYFNILCDNVAHLTHLYFGTGQS